MPPSDIALTPHLSRNPPPENDIEMLQLSALGVAMGNAGSKLKAVADGAQGSVQEAFWGEGAASSPVLFLSARGTPFAAGRLPGRGQAARNSRRRRAGGARRGRHMYSLLRAGAPLTCLFPYAAMHAAGRRARIPCLRLPTLPALAVVVGTNDEDGVAQAIEAHVLAPRRALGAP